MTTPSHPWKQTLGHNAKSLMSFIEPHHLTEASVVRLEETVVVGCYALRRLLNGFLLPESRRHQLLGMTAFPSRRMTSPMLGDEPLSVRYDLNAGKAVSHDLMFVCHQVLQNCVFEPWLGPDRRLIGIYVTSDHQRKIALYGITLTALSDCFTLISGEG